MLKENIKKQIIEIVERNVNTLNNFKLYFFGFNRPGENEKLFYDVGIETCDPISMDVLCKINMEFSSIPIRRKVFMLDFRRLSSELKRIAYDSTSIERH